MEQNIASLNSDEDFKNIIPSPKFEDTKELFIDSGSKFGKVEDEIDSFGDISGINNENNELINDNSLVIINKNISRSNLPKNKILQKLEFKFKDIFENSKSSSIKKNFDYNINSKYNIYESSKQIFKSINKIENKYDFKSIRTNNDRKYNLLFEKNKKMDLNSLREEYFKIKQDNNFNLDYNIRKQKEQNYNKDKKYISIFNNNFDKKNSNSININFDKYKIIKRENKFNFKKNDFNFKNYYKTNNNSKENKNNEKNKYKEFGKELIKKKSTYSFLNINFHDNNNLNIKKSLIFNSLRNLNKSTNTKREENDSWLVSAKNKIKNNSKLDKNYNKIKYIYSSNNNMNNKKYIKNSSIFYELEIKKDKENNKNCDSKIIFPKSYLIDFKHLGNRKKNKIRLINRYNVLNNENCYNLTNDETSNNNISSIKKNSIPFNKKTENNENLLDKFSNNFDAIFNFVESKIKQKTQNNIKETNIKEFNSRYNSKPNYYKINPKILSISQNEPRKKQIIKPFKENFKIKYNLENNIKFPSRNKLSIQITEEISPLRKVINKDFLSNNNLAESSNCYNYNNCFFNKNNETKKLFNLL